MTSAVSPSRSTSSAGRTSGITPERFAARAVSGVSLGRWLSPLVVETEGTVVPFGYGFPRPFALGTVHEQRLLDLAQRWDTRSLHELCATEHRLLSAGQAPSADQDHI